MDRVEPPAEAPERGWLSRASALGLAGLSLVGAVGLGAGRALATEAPPAPAVSRVVEAPDGYLLAPAGLPQAPAPAGLPAPNSLSRSRLDRVEINARIDRVAERIGVPADLVKAVAWQESTWTHARKGELTRQANVDASTGEIRSVDSGIMQINDRAHPAAYPKASTLDGNLEYGSRFLRGLIERFGEEGVWRYNGDPAYASKVARHLDVQPWRVPVLRDHLRALRSEEAALRASLPRSEKSLAAHRQRTEASRAEVDRLAQANATARKLESARRTLETRERKAAEAESALQRDRARLEALPGEILAAESAWRAESDRVSAVEAREYREGADALAGRVGDLETKIRDLRGQAAGVLTGLRKVTAPERQEQAQALKAEAEALRGDLGTRLSSWRSTRTRLKGPRKLRLGAVEKELDGASRAVEAQREALRDLKARAKALR